MLEHEVQKTAYTFGNLLLNPKMIVSALIYVDYYQKGCIDVGGDDDDYFSNVDNGDDDNYKDMDNIFMNLNINMNMHSFNHLSHHNYHGSNKCLK